MTKDELRIAVIIPCYNEEIAIPTVVCSATINLSGRRQLS